MLIIYDGIHWTVGSAPEYVHPQKELEEELQQRIKMAELQLEYRVSSIQLHTAMKHSH